MTTPTPAPGARIARLRRTAARIGRRLTPPALASAPPSATPTISSPASALAAGTAATASTDPSPGHWWTRLERSVALLVSVSTLAVAGTALVTVRQATGEQHLTRDGQVTDRYTAAVTNLGDDNEEVRLGGLYALQRIAQDSPRDAPSIVQVISAYIRGHAPLPRRGRAAPDNLANDVDAALRILAYPLDLDTFADLHGAELRGANLQASNFGFTSRLQFGADLTGAELRDADLAGAHLDNAHLGGAFLTSADLRGADLTSADLRRADLRGADLRGADLTDAHLFGADLTDADLTDADLTRAGLDRTKGYTPAPVPKGQKTVLPTAR